MIEHFYSSCDLNLFCKCYIVFNTLILRCKKKHLVEALGIRIPDTVKIYIILILSFCYQTNFLSLSHYENYSYC